MNSIPKHRCRYAVYKLDRWLTQLKMFSMKKQNMMDQGAKSVLSWIWMLTHWTVVQTYPINSICNRTHAVDMHNQLPNLLTCILWNTMIAQQTMIMVSGMIFIIHYISTSHPRISHEITENHATIWNKGIFKKGTTHSVFASLPLALSCNMLQWLHSCYSWCFHLSFIFSFIFLLTKNRTLL